MTEVACPLCDMVFGVAEPGGWQSVALHLAERHAGRCGGSGIEVDYGFSTAKVRCWCKHWFDLYPNKVLETFSEHLEEFGGPADHMLESTMLES